MRLLVYLILLCTSLCNADEKNIALIVNNTVEIQQVTKLELYKIFTNSSDTPYKLICYYMKDDQKGTPLYNDMNDFLKMAFENNDMCLVNYKSIILDKIRKREVKVTLFKGQPEEVISEVIKNSRFIGLVPKSSITNNQNVKEVTIK